MDTLTSLHRICIPLLNHSFFGSEGSKVGVLRTFSAFNGWIMMDVYFAPYCKESSHKAKGCKQRLLEWEDCIMGRKRSKVGILLNLSPNFYLRQQVYILQLSSSPSPANELKQGQYSQVTILKVVGRGFWPRQSHWRGQIWPRRPKQPRRNFVRRF